MNKIDCYMNMGLQVCRKCRQGTKSWRKKNTDVSNIDWKINSMEEVVDDTTCGHETWIDCSTNNTT